MKKAILSLVCFLCVICMGVSALFAFPAVFHADTAVPEQVTNLATDDVPQATRTGIPAADEALPDGIEIWDGTVATAFAGGRGTQEDPYQIATPAQFALFTEYCGNNRTDDVNNSGAHYFNLSYIITADLCFNPDFDQNAASVDTSSLTPFKGIDRDVSFYGSLDGNNHRLYNLYLNGSTTTSSACGVFGQVGGTVKNLHIVRGYNNAGKASGSVGGIAGNVNGTLYNCSSSMTVKAESGNVGGVVGAITGNGRLEGCEFRGSVSTTAKVAGGIAGTFSEITQVCTLSGCVNRGYVYAQQGIAGGIVGCVGQADKQCAGISMSSCVNWGRVESGANNAGGIVGVAYSLGNTRAMSRCVNFGEVIATGSYAGGMIGTLSIASSTISEAYKFSLNNCYNIGNVTAENYAGGMIGNCKAPLHAVLCSNSGTVKAGSYAGGFAGVIDTNYYAGGASALRLRASRQTGDIIATTLGAGGALGQLKCGSSTESGLTVGGSVVAGTVTAPASAGGVIGVVSQGLYIKAQLLGDCAVVCPTVTVSDASAKCGRLVGETEAGVTVVLSQQDRLFVASDIWADNGVDPRVAITAPVINGGSGTLSSIFTSENLTNGVYLNIMNIYSTKNSLAEWSAGEKLPEHGVVAQMKALSLTKTYDGSAVSVSNNAWSGVTPTLQWYRYDAGTEEWVRVWTPPFDIGKYRVDIALTGERAAGAERIEFEILKQRFDLSALHWQATSKFEYNGKEQSVVLEGLLPDFEVTYSGNKATDYGTYTARLVSVNDPTGRYDIVGLSDVPEFRWMIDTLVLQATDEDGNSNLIWSGIPDGGTKPVLTYNEQVQDISLIYKINPDVNLSAVFNITYSGNSARNAGSSYTASATVSKKGESMNVTVNGILDSHYQTDWEIAIREIDPADYVTLEGLTLPYDALSHEVVCDASRLLSCMQMTAHPENQPYKATGQYEYRYLFTLTDTVNNRLSQSELSATMEITPAVPKVRAKGADTTYDGERHRIEDGSFSITGEKALQEELKACGSLEYEYYLGGLDGEFITGYGGPTNAGEYTVKVIFNPGSNENFAQTYITVPLIINRATLALPGNVVLRDGFEIWDGKPKNLTLRNEADLPEFVIPEYSAPYTDVGQHTVVCSFRFRADMAGNYQDLPDMTATLTIMTYELHDEDTGVSILFPEGEPTYLRMLAQERDDAARINTSWQVGWNTSLKVLYQLELKDGTEPVTGTGVILKVLLPLTDEMRLSRNVTAVSVEIDENGKYKITEYDSEFEEHDGEYYLAFETSSTGCYGIVVGDSLGGLNAWMICSGVVAVLSGAALTVLLVRYIRRRKKNR